MDNLNFPSTPGYSHSHSPTMGRSITIGECALQADIPDSISEDIYAGDSDAVRIARGIFTAEVSDLIVVLRNCGALRTRAECFWCARELWRLLTKPIPGDLT
jgi:hypothetical protein